MIYARKSDEMEQTLEEHIKECLKAFEDLKGTKLRKIFEREEVAKLAIVFHDSGKIFYQRNFRNGKLSFPGHEVLSALVFGEFAWEYEKASNQSLDALLCLAAILYHHHAMDLRKRIEWIGEGNFVIAKSKEELEKILDEHAKIVKKFLPDSMNCEAVERALQKTNDLICRIVRSSDKGVHLSVRDVSERVGEENRKIWEEFQKSREFRRQMLGLATLLLVVDYLGVGSENPTGFGRVVKEFAELYSNL